MKSVLIACIFFGLGMASTYYATKIGARSKTAQLEQLLKQERSEHHTRCVEWANYVYKLELGT